MPCIACGVTMARMHFFKDLSLSAFTAGFVAVLVAWSTPGAAVLARAGAVGGISINEAIGAFLVCAALITLAAWTGWFERVMNRIPLALAAALLLQHLGRSSLMRNSV